MRHFHLAGAALASLALLACGSADTAAADDSASSAVAAAATDTAVQDAATQDAAVGSGTTYGSGSEAGEPAGSESALQAALDAQPDEIKARYGARHPAETLEFIGIAPGMTVVDVLPGSRGEGYYTGILARYLGAGDAPARLIGVNYNNGMWRNFAFATPEFLEGQESWAADWAAGATARKDAGDFGDANVGFAATTFGADNRQFSQGADAALLLRAMHNLHRFEDGAEFGGGYASQALEDLYAMLKPGAVVGVVQHRAPEDMPDDWADGSNGYLKQSRVVELFEDAGFVFEAASEINANPRDVPTTEDSVWRLPPSLRGAREDAELRAEREAIGESDRMTLRFRKPG